MISQERRRIEVPRKPLSKRALKVQAKARELGITLWGNPQWAEAEAALIETPQGLVHLHRLNRRGIGRWNIVTRGHPNVCGTVRCRKVFIVPLGGEEEAARLDLPSYEQIQENYWRARWSVTPETEIEIITGMQHGKIW